MNQEIAVDPLSYMRSCKHYILKNKMFVHDIDVYKSVPKNKKDLSDKGRSHIPYEWNTVGEERFAQARERCNGPSP